MNALEYVEKIYLKKNAKMDAEGNTFLLIGHGLLYTYRVAHGLVPLRHSLHRKSWCNNFHQSSINEEETGILN